MPACEPPLPRRARIPLFGARLARKVLCMTGFGRIGLRSLRERSAFSGRSSGERTAGVCRHSVPRALALFLLIVVVYAVGAELSWQSFSAGTAFGFPPAGVTVAAMLLT